MEPLARRYPDLPWVDLGVHPSPVEEHTIAGLSVLVHRDDRIGGNKARCLEPLLALPAKRLLTVSSLSANHAYTTAVMGRKLGLETDAVIVRWGRPGPARACLDDVAARVVEVEGGAGAMVAGLRLWRPGTRIIPPGGASARGALGYCNAVLELDKVPNRIYTALGTGTTASGLLAGLMLRGADCEVVAVRVASAVAAWQWRLWGRAFGALRLLGETGIRRGGVRLRVVRADGDYGEPTPAAVAAVEAARHSGLDLEETYTGKALAVVLAERAEGAMFLNTYAEPASGAPCLKPPD